MKGLLIKDFNLMKMQRSFFIIIIVIAIGMAYFMYNMSFLVGYLSFIIPVFAISTISYDEFDNGYTFLFTLPVSRKGYVIEKYCFGILLGIGALIFSLILAFCVSSKMGSSDFKDTLLSSPFIFSAMLLLLSIVIPVHLKFGAEKSRIAIIVVCGGIAVFGYIVAKISNQLGFDIGDWANNIANTLSKLDSRILILGVLLIAFCIMLLSIKISITIMHKKEF